MLNWKQCQTLHIFFVGSDYSLCKMRYRSSKLNQFLTLVPPMLRPPVAPQYWLYKHLCHGKLCPHLNLILQAFKIRHLKMFLRISCDTDISKPFLSYTSRYRSTSPSGNSTSIISSSISISSISSSFKGNNNSFP